MPRVDLFEHLLRSLQAAGLWRGVAPDRTAEIVRGLMSGRDVTWPSGGAWRADGEDLAEGDVEDWLRGMARPLADCGVHLTVSTGSSPRDGHADTYAVTVNGRTVDLYRVDGASGRVPLSFDPWLDCTVEPASEVNRLLRAAGTDHRLALFWPGGNDGFSVLGPANVLRRAAASSPDLAADFLLPQPGN